MTTVEDASALVHAPVKRSILERPRSTTGVVELVHHGRPQEDRDHVRHDRDLLLPRRRHRGAVHPRSSSRSPTARCSRPARYNEFFTMHGTTMVFLIGMPLAAAFGNYFVPLMIGARDVAFPRLNMFGFWVFLFGGVFIYSSFVLGGAPDGGWFGYAPLTSTPMSQGFLPGRGADFWAVGLIMLGIGSVATAVNFIVTILNMRAPGHDDDAHAGVRVDDARGRVPHAVRDAAASPPR